MHSRTDLSQLRKDYGQQELDPESAAADPLEQLHRWMEEAIAAGVNEPSAMHLATVDATGAPSGRIVLCKGIDARGLLFYTNYASRKGQQLSEQPRAAATFFWPELERQVRIEGEVSRLPAAESDAYFASRPYASRIGAWASRQSAPMLSRTQMISKAAQIGLRYPLQVPRPDFWGGYVLNGRRFEFWQGRPSRMHDRLLYLPEAASLWRRSRLFP